MAVTIIPEAALHQLAEGWQLVFVEPTKDKGFTVYLTEPAEGAEGAGHTLRPHPRKDIRNAYRTTRTEPNRPCAPYPDRPTGGPDR